MIRMFPGPRRRLMVAGLALAFAAVLAGPAAAQAAPLKRFLAVDPQGNLIWVYYVDSISTVSRLVTPRDTFSAAELRRMHELRGRGKASHGVGHGRHHATGGNTSGRTRTQTYHPGERPTGQPGGAPGRGRGRGR
jgi:hypothetical protein